VLRPADVKQRKAVARELFGFAGVRLTQLCARGERARTGREAEHLAAIRESAAHDYLYDCLSVLDTKASALLQYDGIILAAATLAITLFSRATAGTVLVAVALILSGLSSVLCLQVIWVYWTETAEFSSDKDEFVTLLKRRGARTLCYRASWITAQASVFFLIVGVIATLL
jgi:hypothetical protein